MTENGVEKVEAKLSCGNLYNEDNADLLIALNCALHAEALLKRDVHYLIRAGRVELIDEFTGRVADHRHWPDGLQAAVEAKEGLKTRSRGQILGTITLQHFLSIYPKMCGMTATAVSSTDEFRETYGLNILRIPPHRPSRRVDEPPYVFTHKEAKYKALVQEISAVHRTGRPLLIGTGSVEESSLLANKLIESGIFCNVLNAKNDEMEAELISQAGAVGAVTVSTNMAGRGVDIVLGGLHANPQEYAKVAELGGLYVIGTNLHESIRIDQQLKGRAGRQGDPGSSRFFISLEDDLLSRYGILNYIPQKYASLKQDEPLKDSVVFEIIDHIQRVVDGQNFEIRKTLNKYSDLLEQQRRMIYNQRQNLLLEMTQPELLASKKNDQYRILCDRLGQNKVKRLERYMTLLKIDQCWADYLDYVNYIKEGIHLESISHRNPVDEFHRQIVQAFDKLPDEIEQEILSAFASVDWTKDDIDLELEQVGLKSPSATWTYIINDSFFQNRVSLF